MPADFRYYVDLRPMDVSPAELYLDAIEVARTVLPDFELRPGTIEDAMFQAFAYMTALNVGSINRLPNSLFMGIIKMIGTPYADGQRATMNVKFTANSNDGATIPIGTTVQCTTRNDDFEISYSFETDEQLVIAANELGAALPFGTVAATAQNIGIIPEIQSGKTLSVLSYLPTVYSAVADGNFVQGVDAESVLKFMDRGVARIATMSSGLVTATQLNNYVLTQNPTLVSRSKVYDLTDPDAALLVGDAAVNGHVTVFAYGPQRFLTNTEKTNILSNVSSKTVAGLAIGIKDPILLDCKITAAVKHFSDIESSELIIQLTDALVQQLSISDGAQWTEEKLKYNDVLQTLLNQLFVRDVDSLVISTTDSGAVTGAVRAGAGASQTVTYTAAHKLAVGDLVTVTGVTPNGLNSTQRAVTAITTTTFTVVNSAATGTFSSAGSYSATFPNWGNVSGSDILFSKKGSILNISKHKITITATAV